jgi:hypothetical protein
MYNKHNVGMKSFPIYRLNEAITKSFDKIISLDITEGIREGLDPMIRLVDEQGGPLTTIAEIKERSVLIDKDTPKRYVTLSATYSQILWMICSIVMRNHDSIAINYEYYKMSSEQKTKFEQELLNNDSVFTRYERELLDEKKVLSDSANMLNTIEILSTRKLSAEEMEELYKYDMTSDIGLRVNSLYVSAISFILLHEFSHHSLNHDLKQMGTINEEEAADHNAFWTLYFDLDGKDRNSALLGILCALVSLIFIETSLKDDGVHPLPIERIFYFYDVIKEENTKYAALMCHLFYAWAVYTHDENMPPLEAPYEDTIEKIRTYMLEIEHNNE